MKKKYLKNIDDLEALIPASTKIYRDNYQGYFKFVRGVPCAFTIKDELFTYNAGIPGAIQEYYIEVEDEPSEDDIGKLGFFRDDEDDEGFIDVLDKIDDEVSDKYIGKYDTVGYQHFRPLTPEEVEKYTGYKVVKEK